MNRTEPTDRAAIGSYSGTRFLVTATIQTGAIFLAGLAVTAGWVPTWMGITSRVAGTALFLVGAVQVARTRSRPRHERAALNDSITDSPTATPAVTAATS